MYKTTSLLGQLRVANDSEDDALHLSIAGSFSSSLMPSETKIHKSTISATDFSSDGLPVIPDSTEADAAPSRKRWGILAFIHVFILKLKCKVRRRKSSQEGLVHQVAGPSSADVDMRPTTAHSWANVGYHGHDQRGSKFEMRLGLTRQLAFGPWEDETSSPWRRSQFYRFFTSRYLAMLIAVGGIITVAGLVAFFLMKERELDRRLEEHYGWTKYANSAAASPNGAILLITACCSLVALIRFQFIA